MTKVALIFKSLPDDHNGPNQQIFIEAHDEHGNSINIGDWAADGEYESLTIDLETLAFRLRTKTEADASATLGTSPFALKQLDDVTAIATDPGNALASDYMRGMANGLILAQSIFKGGDPLFFDANGNRVVRSADNFETADRAIAPSNHRTQTLLADWADRKTFVIPDGFEAVRDSEGRATGELRKLS